MTAWRWHNMPFESPFKSQHCVPTAFTLVQRRPTATFLRMLAAAARATPITNNGVSRSLLTPAGGAPSHREAEWARLSGLEIVERFEPQTRTVEVEDARGYCGWSVRVVGRPTLAQFARTHRRGRWVVFTPAHAQAVVAGKIRGWASARQRVRYAVRVKEVTT